MPIKKKPGEKNSDNIENAVITPGTGPKPSQIHSTETGRAAINAAAQSKREASHQSNLKPLIKGAKYLRKVILEERQNPWVFDGSLQDCLSKGVPAELQIFIQWLIQGTNMTAQSDACRTDIEHSVNIVCQHIMQTVKTDRQVGYKDASSVRMSYESPLAVGLSLTNYHNHRSASDLNVLSATKMGITYGRVKEITNQITNSALDNMDKNCGVYIPQGVIKGIPIRASADNVDMKIDTPDGRDSFHGTAVTVYQCPDPADDQILAGEELHLHEASKDFNRAVPTTVLPLESCRISGSPKPLTSPHYRDYRLGQHKEELLTAQRLDEIWLISRYISRELPLVQHLSATEPTTEQTQCIPVWKAYNSTLCKQENSANHVDKSYSLPVLNSPAHEWETLVTVLEKVYNLSRLVHPEDPDSVMVTFDMDLYKRALKLEYIADCYKDKWWLLPGSFHVSLCALRCLGKTIEGSGLDETWIKAGLYSGVVVGQIIDGNHFNRAVEAHETLFRL